MSEDEMGGKRTGTAGTGGEGDAPVGFLTDHMGQPSSMRLMSMTALVASIAFGLITLLRCGGDTDGLYLTAFFLIGAFCPKAIQKFAEARIR